MVMAGKYIKKRTPEMGGWLTDKVAKRPMLTDPEEFAIVRQMYFTPREVADVSEEELYARFESRKQDRNEAR